MLSVMDAYEQFLRIHEERLPTRAPEELREKVAVGQIREILFRTPERCLVCREIEHGMLEVVPLTEHLALCPTGLAVKIEDRLTLGVVPDRAYVKGSELEDFSLVVAKLQEEDVEEILKFVYTYDRKKLPAYTQRFLELLMHRYGNLMWAHFYGRLL